MLQPYVSLVRKLMQHYSPGGMIGAIFGGQHISGAPTTFHDPTVGVARGVMQHMMIHYQRYSAPHRRSPTTPDGRGSHTPVSQDSSAEPAVMAAQHSQRTEQQQQQHQQQHTDGTKSQTTPKRSSTQSDAITPDASPASGQPVRGPAHSPGSPEASPLRSAGMDLGSPVAVRRRTPPQRLSAGTAVGGTGGSVQSQSPGQQGSPAPPVRPRARAISEEFASSVLSSTQAMQDCWMALREVWNV